MYVATSISPPKVTRLSLLNSKLSQSLSLHNLATSFSSDDGSISGGHTPTRQSPSPPLSANHNEEGGSSLRLSLSSSLQALQ